MDDLAPKKNLQRLSVQAIEELFPELYGWGNAVDLNNGGLPRDGLAGAWLIKNNMIGIIGESSITLTTGTIADLPNATWAFPSNAVTLQADTDLGGDVFFDSANSMAPIVRSGAEWYALLNVDFAWIGFHPTRGGVVIYTGDMSAQAVRVQTYLGRYTTSVEQAVNPDDSLMFNPDDSPAYNPA